MTTTPNPFRDALIDGALTLGAEAGNLRRDAAGLEARHPEIARNMREVADRRAAAADLLSAAARDIAAVEAVPPRRHPAVASMADAALTITAPAAEVDAAADEAGAR